MSDELPDAFDADECLLCQPSLGKNAEQHTVIEVLDRERVPLGEDAIDHTVQIPVCLSHYEVLSQYQSGKSVSEVTQP